MSNKTNERSYGQGAQGEPTPTTPTKPTIGQRMKYSFDNSIAKSGMFVTWMFILMVIFSILLVFIKALLFSLPFITNPGVPVVFNFELSGARLQPCLVRVPKLLGQKEFLVS